MPTYEYRCKDCGEELEVVQSFTDDPLTACPACSGVLRKVFGNVGIAFKGSGFYKNDSRRAAKKESKSESSSSSESSSGSSSTSDSKSGSKSSDSKSDSKSNGKKADAKPAKAPAPS